MVSLLQMAPALQGALVSWLRIAQYIYDMTSVRDISDYSCCEQRGPAEEERDGATIELSHVSFGWQNSRILHDISLSLPQGHLLVITGPAGSGKSTLLNSFLGITTILSGQVKNLPVKVGYCDETPWLIDTTIRENITIGRRFETARYRAVLEACDLVPDIRRLSQGDATRVGTNGGRLSGGQRKRVALARALYQECDVLLLDNVLSGLDGKTAALVEQGVFGEGGFLRARNKTAIAVFSTSKDDGV